MSGERSYTTEKSTLENKPEWGGATPVGHHHHHQQQHVTFLHPQQQNLQQTKQPHAPHQLAAGGCSDSATFEPDVGISCEDTLFENPNAIIDASNAGHACHFNAAADGSKHCDDLDMGTAPVQSTFAPQKLHNFGMAAPDMSTKKSHINIAAAGPHEAESNRDHAGGHGQGNLPMSTPIKMPTARRARNAFMSSLTVRPTGTKDRHSKVRTAKGLRDRRVRLSAPTAIQFFDVQDRLGFDQPSKAVDWLIKKARAAIDELAPVQEAVIPGEETTDVPAGERQVRKEHHDGSLVKVKDEEQTMPFSSRSGVRAESRAKARERARERAREKVVTSCAIASPAAKVTATSAATMPVQHFVPSASSSLHLSLPEFFLLSSQLHQPFDDQQRSGDLSSMLSQPSSSALSSHFLPCPPQSSASAFLHPGPVDVPLSFQFSAPPIYTNTPISPRGTLQSIFSNPTSFSMQPHMPIVQRSMSMMGVLQHQAHMYRPALISVQDDRHDNDEEGRQRSAELGSLDLHQHSRIPMRIHGMELDSHVEETRITTTSMQADRFQ